MASTPDGRGYWLAASDGGVFTFGDAGYYGSASGSVGGKPVVAIASTVDGGGYWLVGSDGAVHNFGDAALLGEPGGQAVAIAQAPASAWGSSGQAAGGSYWVAGPFGTVTGFGDASFEGDLASPPDAPVVALVAAG
jgi:hypothetical protein